MNVDWLNIVSILIWIASGAGAGVLAYLTWNEMERAWAKVEALADRIKRYATLGISVAYGWIAYLLLFWFGVEAIPSTPQEWVQKLFAIAAASVIASQTLHGKLKLRGRTNHVQAALGAPRSDKDTFRPQLK